MEKISIIVPINDNFSDNFENFKNSLLNQTFGFEDLEIIFITDNLIKNLSKDLISRFAKKYANVKYIFLETKLDEKTFFEIGLNYSTTNYIMFINPNLFLIKDACKLLYDEIFFNDSDIVIGDYNSNFNKDLLFKKCSSKKVIYEFNDKDDEIFYLDLFLSSRIYKKEFLLKIFETSTFLSWDYFNFLTLINARKVILLNETISFGKNVKKEKKVLNLEKLKVFNKLINKKYNQLTIAIKSPNPMYEKHWGDYFFALSLKKSLEKKGFKVVIHEREYFDSSKDNEDIVIVLRGRVEYNPKPNHINLMWNISHPDDISLEEYERYDYVFIASNKFANEISNQVNTNVNSLLQCTDPEIFYPSENKEFKEDILFVGITRDEFRTIIKDLSNTHHNYSVYGMGWEKFIDEKYIKGEFIPNNILNQAYSSCKILLNDHWEDMRLKDFPSNRLFDALACGTFVISDEIDSAKTIFEDNIITYTNSEDLEKKLDYYLSHNEERELIAKKGQDLVLKNHTFDIRVDEILKTLENYDFNSYIQSINPFLINIDSKDESILRIIILGYKEEKLNEAISNIESINNNISISILNLGDFSKNKFKLEGANFDIKKFVIDNLNSLIKDYPDDFILIMDSESILNKKTIDMFFKDYYNGDFEDIGAIVFDSSYNCKEDYLNYKLGFSPELFLEYDYYGDSIILNRRSILSVGSFDLNCFNNLVRDVVLRLYKGNFKIIKKDFILQEIKNKLNFSSFDENEYLLNKILDGRKYDVMENPYDNSVFPIYDSFNKKASIIIPFKDQVSTTKKCIDSILEKTDYFNYEIILINNNSYFQETFEYIENIKMNKRIKVFDYEGSFNWSKINNFASTKASGDVLVFLNNDTEVISSNWLRLLISDAIQPNIGAVGAKLLYPDNTIQHAGVVIGLTYFAGHIFAKYGEERIPKIFNTHRRNVSSVTGACVAFNKETFEKIGKFNEDFEISFSDIEICLRLIKNGYRNVFNPKSILYHHEMKTRGNYDFRDNDRLIAYNLFKYYLDNGDPFFNKNLSLNSNYLSIRNENEISQFSQFWETFLSQRKARILSIENAKTKANLNNKISNVFISNNKLTESKNVNKNQELYINSINKDIFFYYGNEKLDKITIVFYFNSITPDGGFNLGIEVLKILKVYYGEDINIWGVGSDCNLEDYGLKDVISLGKMGSDLELANIFRRAHICLLFSFESNNPNVFLQCMACGCAVITNYNEKYKSLLKNKENAIVTEPNLDSLIDNIINLIDDFRLRDRIVFNALNFIENP